MLLKTIAAGALTGIGLGFVAGFHVAENLYATEVEIDDQRRRMRVFSAAAAGAAAFFAISVAVMRH